MESDTDLLNGLNEKEQALKAAEEKLHSEVDKLKKSQDELAVEQNRSKQIKMKLQKN